MKKTFWFALLVCCLPLRVFAFQAGELPAISGDDRVLVLAPHPDDETIGAAGVIMRAKAAGAAVKVGCFTNGDHNELMFIMYEKRLTLRKGEFLHMGEVRRKETLAAMSLLGIPPSDVVFFGYPDFGTFSIFMKYWGASAPYKSILTRINKVSYPDAFSFNAPYKGESVIADLTALIKDFRPTKIFVSHPADTNSDHQALYLFLRVALWDLEDLLSAEVYPYIIHVVGWPVPRGYRPHLPLHSPAANSVDVAWRGFGLTPEETARKKQMIDCYKSQLVFNPWYLYTFARSNELYGDCPTIKLRRSPEEVFAWHNVVPFPGTREQEEHLSRLAFARKGDDLYVKIILKSAITRNLGVRILLAGYRRGTDFAAMPKLGITIGLRGMQIKDKQKVVFIKGATYNIKDRIIVVKLPLASMGEPQRILCRSWARFSKEFPFKAPAWRVIMLDE